jgi:hypothetical protein
MIRKKKLADKNQKKKCKQTRVKSGREYEISLLCCWYYTAEEIMGASCYMFGQNMKYVCLCENGKIDGRADVSWR